MPAVWIVFASIVAYLYFLFGVAHFGNTAGRALVRERLRGLVYALSIAVYCTSWTFFGSVGVATSAGLDFLPIYIGPIIAFVFCRRLIEKVIRLAKQQNITSVADLISARYGKSARLAALVTVVSVVGVVPYIALQLKAISASLATVLDSIALGHAAKAHGAGGATSFVVAMILAGFAVAFGTRRVDTTEHQDGLMLAVAVESLVKLAAFIVVGIIILTSVWPAAAPLAHPVTLGELVGRTSHVSTLLTMTVLSFSAILLLPRQFHVIVVENRDVRDVAIAGWLFPLYLVAINVFVLPVALTGLAVFPGDSINRDMTMLALPIARSDGLGTLVALIGGLSAATAMVIVASVALSIMISNDLVVPYLLHRRSRRAVSEPPDLSRRILLIRRVAIVAIIAVSYSYFQAARAGGLASIGLLSFAAVAQMLPAFAAAFFWRRGTARGAIAGICIGTALWLYTLFLPSFADPPRWLARLIAEGPFGLAMLRPTALFDVRLDPLTHGTLWSVGVNAVFFVAFSLSRQATAGEKLQASLFVESEPLELRSPARPGRPRVKESDLETAVARYLGAEYTYNAFRAFLATKGRAEATSRDADAHLLEFAERLLTAAIGAASARLVLALLVRRSRMSSRTAFRLLDDAASAIHYNRDLLQHAIDHARQGIAVFDRDMRLICWNQAFRDIFGLPPELLKVGKSVDSIIAFNAARGFYGPGSTESIIDARLENLTSAEAPFRLRIYPSEKVIEVRSGLMPDGGAVTTYSDITDSVLAEEKLAADNEALEQRVRHRTDELVQLNSALAQAKSVADAANASKTRFLAAASHDILQPLNAARLYTSALVERVDAAVGAHAGATEATAGSGAPTLALDAVRLAHNIDASLGSVEEILTALLDISRLDAGAMVPERSVFRVEEVLRQLRLEFAPFAAEKHLDLRFVTSSASIRSDRRLLRRLLQNLISNAIKYTPAGRVLVGCRVRGRTLQLQVWDTGIGIAPEQQDLVFHEFRRLEGGARVARGLGLGLSIVERLGRVLGHKVLVASRIGRGSMFGLEVPIANAVPEATERPQGAARDFQPLDGLVVLVIDNEQRILDGMEALLGGWGCAIIRAVSLEAALKALRSARAVPHVVIADFHLDDGDGIEAITTLRWKFDTALKAVLLTADRGDAVAERALAKGIALLSKPLKPAALRALLVQWRVERSAAE